MFSTSKVKVKSCLEDIQQQFDIHKLFFGHGTDNAWDEACWLLETVLKRDGITNFAEDTLLTSSQLAAVNDLVLRRVNEKKPLAYLLNEAWFAGLPFYVDERVLVPRSPLAELIVNGFSSVLPAPPERILDLCTGSGCIGIASALALPESRVELADLSLEALAVADKNILKHDLEGRVTTTPSDLFEGVKGTYDLIVSNPPYVSQEEYDDLPEEYLNEPELGLVSLNNGLAIPQEILMNAANFLTDTGVLLLEVGYSWQALAEALPEFPFLWLDFEFGGEGVCLLNKQELQAAALTFRAR